MVTYACHPGTWEIEVGESEVQGPPGLLKTVSLTNPFTLMKSLTPALSCAASRHVILATLQATLCPDLTAYLTTAQD